MMPFSWISSCQCSTVRRRLRTTDGEIVTIDHNCPMIQFVAHHLLCFFASWESEFLTPRVRQLVVGTSGTIDLKEGSRSARGSGMDHFVSKLDVKEVVDTVSKLVYSKKGGSFEDKPSAQVSRNAEDAQFKAVHPKRLVTFNEVVRFRVIPRAAPEEKNNLWWSPEDFHFFCCQVHEFSDLYQTFPFFTA